MLSNKPYLMRAFYEWILDNGWVPVLMAKADNSQCQVPPICIDKGEIVLNVSPNAVRDFKITKQAIQFRTSFSGVVHFISIPVTSVVAIFADEDNSQGIFFDQEENTIEFPMADAMDDISLSTSSHTNSSREFVKQKPHLTLVE